MKILKSFITLTVALLILFSCSNPSIVDGVEQSFQAVEEGADYVELVVGLKETGRPISQVAAEIEDVINGAMISNSRGAQPQAVVSLKRVHEPNMALIPGSRSAGQPFTDADYAELSTELERALYRDFQFTVHKDLAAEVMVKLAERADIDYVQENHRYEPDYQPNDPVYLKGTLYGLKTTFTDKAWNITTGSPDIVVAVIDSGIEKTHPDLAANIWQGPGGSWGYDFDANDNDPSPTSSDHGTHVAGTIGAVGNNGEGVIGVAPNIKLMALKVFPSGRSTVLANAIRYAADNGARVLNNSWGSKTRKPSDPTIEKAIEYAHAKGAVIIFSAGNNNDDANYYYAKNHPKTIVVAAVDKDNKKASFSNYGSCVDIAAPGHYIFSTVRWGKYRMNSGTSMAAPHVSGLAALILSKNPHYTNEKVRDVLKATATKVSSTKYIGAGVMNSYAALTYGGGGPVVDKIAPSVPAGLNSTAVGETTVTLAWSASTDNVGVTGYKLYKDGVYSKTVTGLDVVVTGLKAKTAYKFEVSAVDAAGNESAKSQALSVTTKDVNTGGDKVAPTQPAGLSAGQVTETTIALSWRASTDNVAISGYRVYKDGVLALTTTGPTATNATIKGLTAGTTYNFTVSAVDTSDNESPKSTVLSVKTEKKLIGGAPEWKTGVSYKVGDKVSYKGVEYSCRMAHTSITGWTPVNVPALWSKI